MGLRKKTASNQGFSGAGLSHHSGGLHGGCNLRSQRAADARITALAREGDTVRMTLLRPHSGDAELVLSFLLTPACPRLGFQAHTPQPGTHSGAGGPTLQSPVPSEIKLFRADRMHFLCGFLNCFTPSAGLKSDEGVAGGLLIVHRAGSR